MSRGKNVGFWMVSLFLLAQGLMFLNYFPSFSVPSIRKDGGMVKSQKELIFKVFSGENTDNSLIKRKLEKILEVDFPTIKEFELNKLTSYLAQFSDPPKRLFKYVPSHAKRIYDTYRENIELASRIFGLDMPTFLGLIGIEGGYHDSISPTGGKGIPQMFHPAAKDSVKLAVYNYPESVLSDKLSLINSSFYIDQMITSGTYCFDLMAAYYTYLKSNFLPDSSLAVAAYQLGPGKMSEYAKHYLKWNRVSFVEGEESLAIASNGVTILDLIGDRNVRMHMITNKGKYDLPTEYAPAVMYWAYRFDKSFRETGDYFAGIKFEKDIKPVFKRKRLMPRNVR